MLSRRKKSIQGPSTCAASRKMSFRVLFILHCDSFCSPFQDFDRKLKFHCRHSCSFNGIVVHLRSFCGRLPRWNVQLSSLLDKLCSCNVIDIRRRWRNSKLLHRSEQKRLLIDFCFLLVASFYGISKHKFCNVLEKALVYGMQWGTMADGARRRK